LGLTFFVAPSEQVRHPARHRKADREKASGKGNLTELAELRIRGESVDESTGNGDEKRNNGS